MMIKKPKGKCIVIEETEIVKPVKAKEGKWIQGAIKKPGALHRQLKVPQNQSIPVSKLKKAIHSSSPLERKRATLAMTLKKFSN